MFEDVEVSVAVVVVWLIVWWSMPNTSSYGLLDVARCAVIFSL